MFTRGLVTGFMVGPLVAALIVVSGLWPVMGTAGPPAWETTMARRTLTDYTSLRKKTCSEIQCSRIMPFFIA
jgi:hypothetical protein